MSPRPPIGYLISQYPAYSHGFIESEIGAMREQGWSVEILSVNEPGVPNHPDNSRVVSFWGSSYLRLFLVLLQFLFRRPIVAIQAYRYQRGRQMSVWRGRRGWRVRAIAHVLQAIFFLRHVDKSGVKHVHVHFSNSGADVGRLISILSGSRGQEAAVTWSMAVHGPTDFDEEGYNDLRGKVHCASFVSCISEYARSRVVELCGARYARKLAIVRMGVDIATFRSDKMSVSFERIAESQNTDVTRVLFVGRLVSKKGVFDLVQAVASIDERRPGLLELYVVGDGPETKKLLYFAGKYEWLHVIGAQDRSRVLDWYHRTDIFCLPSYSEGLPAVLMEAMACEVPVVTTPIAGVRELVEDGVSGFLVSPGDQLGLAGRIEELTDSELMRRTLAREGRERVEVEFASDLNARRLSELIDDVVRQNL